MVTLDPRLDRLEAEVSGLPERMTNVEVTVSVLSGQVSAQSERMNSMETRMTGMETRTTLMWVTTVSAVIAGIIALLVVG